MLPFNKLLDSRYIVTKMIAVGGMAEIYECHDTFTRRTVAMKILKEATTNFENVESFKNEVRLASAFNDAHVFKIFNVGSIDARPYMTYEILNGKTMKEVLDERGSFDSDEAIDYMIQIASTVRLIHSHEITHNDLKPDNLMLLHDGIIKVVDFGIATRCLEPAKTHLFGSAQYLDPDVILSKTYTKQSDIYSLGIILFEFVTGKTPFMKCNSHEEMKAHLNEEIQSISDIGNIKHSKQLDKIVRKATCKNKKERYQSVDEMLDDLLEIKSKNKDNQKGMFSRLFHNR